MLVPYFRIFFVVSKQYFSHRPPNLLITAMCHWITVSHNTSKIFHKCMAHLELELIIRYYQVQDSFHLIALFQQVLRDKKSQAIFINNKENMFQSNKLFLNLLRNKINNRGHNPIQFLPVSFLTWQ